MMPVNKESKEKDKVKVVRYVILDRLPQILCWTMVK